jgi:hypothetical protein
MAYTNYDIYRIVTTLARKDSKGNILPESDFNVLLQSASIELFDKEYKKYEQTQEITDTLRRFKVIKTGAQLTIDTSGGKITIPTDYAHKGELAYKYNGTTFRPIDIVTDDQWYSRIGSFITQPSIKYPIAKMVGNYFYYSPFGVSGLQSAYVELSYLRYPTTPVFAMTINPTTYSEQYDTGTSVELDWNEDDKLRISGLILAKLGITVSENSLFQYGQQIEKEQ